MFYDNVHRWEVTYLEYDDEVEKEVENTELVTIIADKENNKCEIYGFTICSPELNDYDFFLQRYQSEDAAEIALICIFAPAYEKILKIERLS